MIRPESKPAWRRRPRRVLALVAFPVLMGGLTLGALFLFAALTWEGDGGSSAVARATAAKPCSGPRGRDGTSLLQSLVVPSYEGRKFRSNDLAKGVTHEAWVFGVFIYDGQDRIADGLNMLVNGRPTARQPSGSREYCVPLGDGGGEVSLRLQDSIYEDNRGVLNVEIYRVAE